MAWWIRLSELRVSSELVREFFRWRRASDENAAAYRQLELEAEQRRAKVR